MMGKVDRRVKREGNSKFPPWDFVPYKDQIEDYFRIIKKLSGKGFNAKAHFPPTIVFNVDIAKIFGIFLKVSKLPTWIFTQK